MNKINKVMNTPEGGVGEGGYPPNMKSIRVTLVTVWPIFKFCIF